MISLKFSLLLGILGGALSFNVLPYGFNCPKGYTFVGGNDCMYYSPRAENWKTAHEECLKTGGELPSIHNADQNAYIAKSAQGFTGNTQNWIGIQGDAFQHQWKWTDKTPLDYKQFKGPATDFSLKAYLDKEDLMWKLVEETEMHTFTCVAGIIPWAVAPDGTSLRAYRNK